MKKETENNVEKYMTLIQAVDPELYDIKLALMETGVNPIVIPIIIRSISNLFYGTGHGKVQVFMQAGRITSVNPEERLKVDVDAVLIEEQN